ncbi:hypothetical protein DQ237_12080 [Blastococcus sp. TF02-8]|uniref:YciI family protein n=1 Tax=Blastococcus sp. TF02-8 TaxID=2250574 RepID=UPI000DEB8291|nr:YciI family protein [Blastococcus sp. TF02-8]RBY95874.1 hypothetical protein DQ237_12080 [Blastococcus sp. TF02-8]
MPRYLILFDEGAMAFPAEELQEVARAATAVVAEARQAGVWVFGAGVQDAEPTVVGTDGAVAHGLVPPGRPHVGGFTVVDVPTREDALAWAARIATACRCAQEVWELMPDAEV